MPKKLFTIILNHKRLTVAVLAFYYIVAVAIILLRSFTYPSLYPQNGPREISLQGPFCVVEDGTVVSNTTLPHTPSSKTVRVMEVIATLPAVAFEHAALVTDVYQMQLEVELAGKILYTSPGIPGGGERFTPGSARVSVPLTHDFAGKKVILRYYRLVPADLSSAQPITLHNPYFAPLFQLPPGSKLLFFSLSTMLFVGIALALVAMGMDLAHFWTKPLFYLAMFVIGAPTWMLCNNKTAQFFTLNTIFLHNLEYICFYAFLLFLWAFIHLNWRFCSRITLLALHLLAGFNLIATTAKLLGLADYYSFAQAFHLVALVNVGLFGYCALQSRHSNDLSLRLFFSGFFVGGATCLADLVRFYFFPSFMPMFSVLGLGGMAVFMACSFIASNKRNVQAQIENSVYKKMAHTDHLTGLFNRLSFELEVERLENTLHQDGSILFVNLDVNRFKAINDTYGHIVGDQVLKAIADQLLLSFRGIANCYRMGGDEFCLIAAGQHPQHIEELLELLNQRLHCCMAEFSVSAAYGIAEYKQFSHQNLMEVFRDADDRMYLHKRNSRQALAATDAS